MIAPLRGMVLALVSLAAPAPHADVSGTELAATCARALAHGYSGLEAEACNWYVAPCEVCGVAATATPAWCVPPATPTSQVAALVVNALRQRSAAGALPARGLVADILARAYPCP